MHKANATVVFKDIEGGFYGLQTQEGDKLLPIPFPDQLKYDGYKVSIVYIDLDVLTINNWGKPVRLTHFHTLPKL